MSTREQAVAARTASRQLQVREPPDRAATRETPTARRTPTRLAPVASASATQALSLARAATRLFSPTCADG